MGKARNRGQGYQTISHPAFRPEARPAWVQTEGIKAGCPSGDFPFPARRIPERLPLAAAAGPFPRRMPDSL